MIKAVIFDFDGLILDTETAWFQSYKEVLNDQFKFDLPLEVFVKCVGSNDTALVAYLKKEIGDQLDANAIRERAGELHAQLVKEAKAREGVEAYLAEAREAGLTIALATSSTKKWVTTHLTNLNLISYFDYLITQDMVELVKPAPDLFLKTLEILKVEPYEAIVFEDSLNGLMAALEAKLPTVIIPNPVTELLPFENYHLKLNSMADMSLQDIIESLKK
ncbi:HAD family hydrolase [Oceanobacillus polygoni]|uniref:Hydrolase of the HAD superfamily n=1 Tax=Oceanobacillus polygoni TaxID=1235259 RepID=A0A9X0YUV1_9BACI|nr:HAD family hydrolase [Oceanobacillus polygoni]MBP2079113.1 putative hydrolase of the HAD superfamily [Oceanobacillus polygoni]